MSERIRAILIQPSIKQVSFIEDDFGDDFRKIAKPLDCQWVEHISLGNGDGLWIDEEGRLNGAAKTRGEFWLRGPNNVIRLAGNGLIIGDDSEGGLISPKLSVPDVWSMVEWDEPTDNKDDGKPHMEFHAFSTEEELEAFRSGAGNGLI